MFAMSYSRLVLAFTSANCPKTILVASSRDTIVLPAVKIDTNFELKMPSDLEKDRVRVGF